jgi:hypothetical protein
VVEILEGILINIYIYIKIKDAMTFGYFASYRNFTYEILIEN